jgi:hypothetical protein
MNKKLLPAMPGIGYGDSGAWHRSLRHWCLDMIGFLENYILEADL